MNKKIKNYFLQEIQNSKNAISNQNIVDAWNSLERAHILGQCFWKEHLYVHVLMFILSLRTFNIRELVGQVPRLILAAPGSILNKAPIGNVGTTRVGIFQEMIIPDELKQILE